LNTLEKKDISRYVTSFTKTEYFLDDIPKLHFDKFLYQSKFISG